MASITVDLSIRLKNIYMYSINSMNPDVYLASLSVDLALYVWITLYAEINRWVNIESESYEEIRNKII